MLPQQTIVKILMDTGMAFEKHVGELATCVGIYSEATLCKA